ncbi:MAG: hypothetical protein ACO3JL_07005 [Myxococcota bacterium]
MFRVCYRILVAPLLLCWALSPALGCGRTSLDRGVFRNDQVHYRITEPATPWRQVRVQTADATWLHDDLSASLLVNSHCEGVQDAPLSSLANELLIGFTERVVLQETRFELSRREALERELTARLDGVPRQLKVLVIKKDGCVYDVVLSSPPEHFAAATAGYEALRAGFEIFSRPGRGTAK